MRSKAPLAMMEQIVMVLIFALASALCLQTFVLSGKLSKRTEAENRGAVEAQNAAESIKALGMNQYIQEQNAVVIKEGFRIFFDEEWDSVFETEQAVYYLDICPVNHDNEYFWRADIVVTEKDGTELFRIPAAGQTEVTQNE